MRLDTLEEGIFWDIQLKAVPKKHGSSKLTSTRDTKKTLREPELPAYDAEDVPRAPIDNWSTKRRAIWSDGPMFINGTIAKR